MPEVEDLRQERADRCDQQRLLRPSHQILGQGPRHYVLLRLSLTRVSISFSSSSPMPGPSTRCTSSGPAAPLNTRLTNSSVIVFKTCRCDLAGRYTYARSPGVRVRWPLCSR